MKKLLTILLILVSLSGIAQVRTFLGPKGAFIYDTTKYLQSGSSYLLIPNDSTISIDSSKIAVSLVKNATRDSFYLVSGSGSILSRAKDSVGSGGGGGSYTGANGIRLFGSVFKIPGAADYSAGSKFIWDSATYSFRAGSVSGTEWDAGNIGLGSTAFGLNTKASGAYSFSAGNAVLATGSASVSIGATSTASGVNSGTWGASNTANNTFAHAIGTGNTASGTPSMAIGRSSTASGDNSVALGYILQSNGFSTVALGMSNENTAAASYNSWNALNRVLQIGTGTNAIGTNTGTSLKQNSLTGLFNGHWGYGVLVPQATIDISGGTTTGRTPIMTHYVAPITITASSGTGSIATITYAAQPAAPFLVGSYVEVSGNTPSAYNGVWVVATSTTTATTFSSTATGSMTVAGTISSGGLNATPKPGALEFTTRPYFTGQDGVRGYIALTFTGTAAPATTPSVIGDHFIDTVNKKEYVATGTASSADWTILN